MRNNLKGSIVLLFTALIWGTTFIMQKKASGLVDAFTFNFFRSIIAFVLLAIIAFITRNKIEISTEDEEGNIVVADGTVITKEILETIRPYFNDGYRLL